MSKGPQDRTCLIIGAGMAGLTAGERLAKEGVDVTIIDKGRGVGGRMAYRRIGKACFDHGAQFITARSEFLKERAKAWLNEGVIREWSMGFPRSDGEPVPDHFPHYCGAHNMRDVTKHLAKGLDVHTGVQVTAIERRGGYWEAHTDGDRSYRGHDLILTPPVPQSLSLLDAGAADLEKGHRDALEAIRYDPCIAVMAHMDGPSQVPDPGGLRVASEPLEWIADNHMKGISPDAHGLTLHAGPGFSRQRLEDDPDRVAEDLLTAARPWTGSKILEVQVHRWRYSKPVQLHPEPFLAARESGHLIFAGDAFQGPRVEGAALSGLAAAEHLLELRVG